MVVTASADGALVVDDAGESADRVTVDGVVDGTVADTGFLHLTDDALEGVEVL